MRLRPAEVFFIFQPKPTDKPEPSGHPISEINPGGDVT